MQGQAKEALYVPPPPRHGRYRYIAIGGNILTLFTVQYRIGVRVQNSIHSTSIKLVQCSTVYSTARMGGGINVEAGGGHTWIKNPGPSNTNHAPPNKLDGTAGQHFRTFISSHRRISALPPSFYHHHAHRETITSSTQHGWQTGRPKSKHIFS
jgi:hypothetical protein